ncbi:RNA-splicing ligase RtcB [bacterium (Candidatus Torokbacteria) CG_4_10_14_0_2_um_filter_35_8]|nr:MAG: RNA-splicing ligase RtcB [bacterium (Candidatus Torokbacteria) CG_4_10_14_0_2_um_filter_35_8]
MLVEGKIYVNDNLYPHIFKDRSLEQLAEACELTGVIEPIVGMPDIHEGFGLPIGGVMAMDSEKGLISAGSVGMDINCGVRLIRTDIPYDPKKMDKSFIRKIMIEIENRIPTGVGKKAKRKKLTMDTFEKVVTKGSALLTDKGYGFPEDKEATEENGCLKGASLSSVSSRAIQRGASQLATLGGGNHFIEIQHITEVFDEKLGEEFGLKKGNLAVMIHTGSRGFGHQICTDYTNILWQAGKKYGVYVPRMGLAACPISSKEGKDYFSAMACAVNFAFSNRQLIVHDVRQAFEAVFKKSVKSLGMELVYDVAHNIAKFETFRNKKILIHRKGATRALCPGHPDNPEKYKNTGHPAIIPGSMGTASFVLVGTKKAEDTFFSVNHGSGRMMSRGQARRTISKEQFEKSMGEILYNTRSFKDVLDEAPDAYKNIYDVVDTLVEAGITKKVAMLKPLGVIKGAD